MGLQAKQMTGIQSQRGVALLEILVATAIVGLIGGGLMALISASIRIPAQGTADLTANFSMQRAASSLSKDLQMAAFTDLVDAAPPVSSVTLSWTDEYNSAGTNHSSMYSLSSTDLRRNYDGTVTTMARNISAIDFSINGKAVTVGITSEGKQFTYTFALRPN